MYYNRETINKNIEILRQEYIKEKGEYLSYDKLAEILGVNKTTVLSWLKDNKDGIIPYHKLFILCDLFDCEIGHILGEYPTKKRENKTVVEITGLKEKTIDYLKEGTQEQLAFIDTVVNECLNEKKGFLFSLMNNRIDDKQKIEEAENNPYFTLIDNTKREVEEDNPKLKTPETISQTLIYEFTLADIHQLINNKLIDKLKNEQGINSIEASKRVEIIEAETNHFFIEYYLHKAFANLQIIDLQNALALYLKGGNNGKE